MDASINKKIWFLLMLAALYSSYAQSINADLMGKTVTYSYDNNGNRITETHTDNATSGLIKDLSLSYNSRDQLTDISDSVDSANNASYSYDPNGNQIQKITASLTSDYIYDARNNLRTVTAGGSTLGQFLYDHQGLRVEKIGDRGTERYSYDDQSVLIQFDDSNTTIAKYDYGPNRLLSLNHHTEGLQFYLSDGLNSIVNLTATDGSVQARYQYDAWGNKRNEAGASHNRFSFTGYEQDTETDLLYAKARYYDPHTGRFLSHDAFEGEINTPPSLHRYLYAYGNPTVYIDLDGNRTFKLIDQDGNVTFTDTPTPEQTADIVNPEPAQEKRGPNPRDVRNENCDPSNNCNIFDLDRQDGDRADAAFTARSQQARVTQESQTAPTAVTEADTLLATRQQIVNRQQAALDEFGATVGKELAGIALFSKLDKLVSAGKKVKEFVKRKKAARATKGRKTLYHYTDDAGLDGILNSKKINPSLKANNPKDARFGDGQYLSDIAPGTKTCAQLSRCFIGQPFQGKKFKNFVEVDVTGLNVVKGRDGVFVVPNNKPLDITNRVISSGAN